VNAHRDVEWHTAPKASKHVVVRGVLAQHATEASLPKDQHAVDQLGPDGQQAAFGESVRPRTEGRDLDHLDTPIGQHRVERSCELSCPVATPLKRHEQRRRAAYEG
jgi:hypothetical protein